MNRLVYIFTEFGAVSFSPVFSPKPTFNRLEVKPRDLFRKVYFHWNKIFVVTGKEGVDVYMRQASSPVFNYTYTILLNDTKSILDI